METLFISYLITLATSVALLFTSVISFDLFVATGVASVLFTIFGLAYLAVTQK
jgi:hypothetical protein